MIIKKVYKKKSSFAPATIYKSNAFKLQVVKKKS